MAEKKEKILRALGDHLTYLRQEKGYTQDELADRAALSREQISRLERGEKNAQITTLIALSEALEIPLQELISFKMPKR